MMISLGYAPPLNPLPPVEGKIGPFKVSSIDGEMTFLSSNTTGRPVFWVNLALFLWVSFLMSQNGPIGKNTLFFSLLYAGAFILLWLLYWTFPGDWSTGVQLILILSVAILCRIFFFEFPASYDVNRYIWEGYIFNQGINPYLQPPGDPALQPLITSIWHDINHKDASACYPPMIILLFSFLSKISQSPLFFKMVLVFFDIALIPILALLLKLRNIQFKNLMIYALNPLILVFIAGEGHLDSIQIFFIIIALLMFGYKKDGWGFFTLGCAVMSKYYAVILFPFFVNGDNWKKSLILFVPFTAYLPFLDSGYDLFSSLMNFGTAMHYNDSLTAVLRFLFSSEATSISITILFLCLVVVFLVVHDTAKGSYLAMASLLIFLPTLHPWYLVALTPFLVIFPSRAWLYLHFAMVLTFPVLAVEYATGIFQERHAMKWLVYLPFFTLLLFDFLKKRPITSDRSFGPVKNISVVIPALNEAESITVALASLQKEEGLLETIVVDGGSSDPTREIAEHLGAVVIESEQGRGLQIGKGVVECRGDVILILHADCRIIPGTFKHILQKLNQYPHCIGGSLGMGYELRSSKIRCISSLNNLRARWTGISFGDQAQFLRTEALDMIGGFPEQMLMEDVELSLRLKESGTVCHIQNGVIASKRRWDDKGFFQNFSKVIMLCFEYLIKRRLGLGDSQGKTFYRRYYSVDSL